MKHPFEYCALRYLILWEEKERELHAGMKTAPSLEYLRRSLSYFRISRNFKNLREELKAASILVAISRFTNDGAISPIEKVMALAAQFKTDFGQLNLSAASKLLWLTFRSPYIVYDDRAVTGLKVLGHKFDKRSYTDYYAAWQAEYKERESEVKCAAEALTTIQPFFAAWHKSEDSIGALTREPWFHERVFDIYLWELGGAV